MGQLIRWCGGCARQVSGVSYTKLLPVARSQIICFFHSELFICRNCPSVSCTCMSELCSLWWWLGEGRRKFAEILSSSRNCRLAVAIGGGKGCSNALPMFGGVRKGGRMRDVRRTLAFGACDLCELCLLPPVRRQWPSKGAMPACAPHTERACDWRRTCGGGGVAAVQCTVYESAP